jgi:hypothetical protein
MMIVSHRILKILAAAIWYIGSLILVLKGSQLLLEADALRTGLVWTWLAVAAGVVLGALKARYIFNRSCRRNLRRIDSLEMPRIWQFYSPGFFLALTAMIAAGATLSRLAHGSYPFLIGVAVLDIAIASALLISSHVYWRRAEVAE